MPFRNVYVLVPDIHSRFPELLTHREQSLTFQHIDWIDCDYENVACENILDVRFVSAWQRNHREHYNNNSRKYSRNKREYSSMMHVHDTIGVS